MALAHLYLAKTARTTYSGHNHRVLDGEDTITSLQKELYQKPFVVSLSNHPDMSGPFDRLRANGITLGSRVR